MPSVQSSRRCLAAMAQGRSAGPDAGHGEALNRRPGALFARLERLLGGERALDAEHSGRCRLRQRHRDDQHGRAGQPRHIHGEQQRREQAGEDDRHAAVATRFADDRINGPDVFVAKLNPTGTALVYSTYLGGSGFDFGRAIAIDAAGNAYVTGKTLLFFHLALYARRSHDCPAGSIDLGPLLAKVGLVTLRAVARAARAGIHQTAMAAATSPGSARRSPAARVRMEGR